MCQSQSFLKGALKGSLKEENETYQKKKRGRLEIICKNKLKNQRLKKNKEKLQHLSQSHSNVSTAENKVKNKICQKLLIIKSNMT